MEPADGGGPHGRRRDRPGDHSTVNYKDGLAITGKAPVVRKFPLIAGIDFRRHGGVPAASAGKPGDKVVLNGWGVGERIPAGWRNARA